METERARCGTAPDEPVPFWRAKPLAALSEAEWESLCDGCGRCCLVKLEDEDSGEIHVSDIACRLFDEGSCRCRDYAARDTKVPDCVRLTPANIGALPWLPETCAYRLVAEGRDLAWWHPLVSGDPSTVIAAGISVLGQTAGSEDDYTIEEIVERVLGWAD